jgi:hypothetical protein
MVALLSPRPLCEQFLDAELNEISVSGQDEKEGGRNEAVHCQGGTGRRNHVAGTEQCGLGAKK